MSHGGCSNALASKHLLGKQLVAGDGGNDRIGAGKGDAKIGQQHRRHRDEIAFAFDGIHQVKHDFRLEFQQLRARFFQIERKRDDFNAIADSLQRFGDFVTVSADFRFFFRRAPSSTVPSSITASGALMQRLPYKP